MNESEKLASPCEKQYASPLLSIVVPVYNEESNINHFLDVVRINLSPLEIIYEVILVDDGSADNTWNLIKCASAADRQIKGISLSRNFGHQSALFAGLHLSSGQAIVTMDGDLQHPPESIIKMLELWRQGYRVVETTRIDSEDFSWFKRVTSRLFYKMFSALSGLPIGRGTSDFRLIDRKVAVVMLDMRDSELFLRGITHWVGFPMTILPYQANPRFSGKSKFGILKMVKFSIASILSFSLIPLKLGIWIGLATSSLAFAELIYIVIRFFQGETVQGWASILTVISFMFGVLFILIGILGTYLGTAVEMLKKRPRFIINDTCGQFDEG